MMLQCLIKELKSKWFLFGFVSTDHVFFLSDCMCKTETMMICSASLCPMIS